MVPIERGRAAQPAGISENDVICAGAKNDQVWGGKGTDALAGEGGSDRLYAGVTTYAFQLLLRGDGNDKMLGGGLFD